MDFNTPTDDQEFVLVCLEHERMGIGWCRWSRRTSWYCSSGIDWDIDCDIVAPKLKGLRFVFAEFYSPYAALCLGFGDLRYHAV
jgi:hypothetical protein